MRAIFLIFMFIIGACIGSFLCCQARRLHLKSTKKSSKKLPTRSVCLSCKSQLKWYDNLPIISWLALKGKCRQCHQKIGIGEIVSELSVGITFLLLGLNLDFDNYYHLIILAPFIINMLFLAIYDGLYSELPTIGLYCAIALAAILSAFSPFSIPDILASVAVLGGTYLALYLVSKGRWVGDGDWLLGVAIGLALAKPFLALLALFLSNILACLVMLPLTRGKNHRVPYGPFLIAAFIIIYSFRTMI